jgi:hypothetical protein
MPIEYEYTYDKSCFRKDYPSRTDWDFGNNLMFDDEEDDDDEEEEEGEDPTSPLSRIRPPIETMYTFEAPYAVLFTAAKPPQNQEMQPGGSQQKQPPVKRELDPDTIMSKKRKEGNQFECTASLIGELWALTAAHCKPYVRTNQFIL